MATLWATPFSWLSKSIVNGVVAGAARHARSKASEAWARITRAVPAGAHDAPDGPAEAAVPPNPSVGLNTIRYRINRSPTNPIPATARGRLDVRIESNC